MTTAEDEARSSSSTTGTDAKSSESGFQIDEKHVNENSDDNDKSASNSQDDSPDGDVKDMEPECPIHEKNDEGRPTEDTEDVKVDTEMSSDVVTADSGSMKRRSSDTDVAGVAKKIHVEIEKPAVEAGHGYLNSMDITAMSYDEYLTEFRALQERSKTKFQSVQQQLRQLQQHQRQHQHHQHHHQHFQHQNRMQPQNMNFNGNVNMPPPPMMGVGGMGGPPGGGPPPMGNMQHHMGMGPGSRW
eukprot:CAMPEP_0114434004 /NCGR_PEP_ID=MMETSP0103-20121206/12008_1 /TAXON_ID=37642 ORGANISM="Paraphysomonas imperforata, Strain PA2" /NCGR_SAMPLE_ID=MMETSP0103 /ASSEMBLY_ACC=CAM_ASM_000201 /LENGTH=242 /DNA_ID=CAMNT_0001603819 /DNA_START=44 /DNA_END=769 /DNA_ORIENTATION=-